MCQKLILQRHARSGILLQYYGLPGGFPDGVVLRYLGTAPGVVVAPLIRVYVEGAVVDGFDGEVLDEIDAFIAAVGVRTVSTNVAWGKPAFVSEGNHVVWV